jgi:hypothetical protein
MLAKSALFLILFSNDADALHFIDLFRRIPPLIGKLTRLVTLDMSYNHLEHLPEEIGECRLLSSVDLQVSVLIFFSFFVAKLMPENCFLPSFSGKSCRRLVAGNAKVGSMYHCTIDLLFDWFGIGNGNIRTLRH